MSRFRTKSSIDEIYIHCTDTPNGRATSTADIDQWHGEGRVLLGKRPFQRSMNARNGTGPWEGSGAHAPELGAIGYHFFIPVDGQIQLGRRISETGAHAKGYNERSIGICMAGRDKYTQAQWNSLKQLVRGLHYNWRTGYGVDLAVRAHYEVAPHKTCPGFSVMDWLDADMATPSEHLLEVEDAA